MFEKTHQGCKSIVKGKQRGVSMVTVSVSAPREEGFLTTAPLLRAILVVEHDPSRGESVIQHFSFKPHHHTQLVTSAAAALNFVKHIKPDLFLLAYHLP